MRLRTKVLLLAVVPFLCAVGAIGIGVREQAAMLSDSQRATMQAAYLASKKVELQHYVDLALTAVAPIYEADLAAGGNARDTRLRQQQVMAMLEKMNFGQDGYFFVYDMHGHALMHPREPDLVGRDLWAMRDPNGALPIQELTAAAARGGGYVSYVWHRPSTGKVAPKLAYAVSLSRWHWMLGTGVYLDDINATLAQIDHRALLNIHRTMMGIAVIALAALAAIAGCALALNISEYRSANVKLKQLAQQVVDSQEAERARLSRELHDGISQMIVSAKLLIESASEHLRRSGADVPAAQAALSTGLARLTHTLREVRCISHALRPAMLDDLGLAAALEQLTRELREETGIAVDFTHVEMPHAPDLSDAETTVLFRIAQESLTNIVQHARASRALLTLMLTPVDVTLTIADNGRGFDVARALTDPGGGIGLRNMRERLETLGGSLSITSQPGSTLLSARVALAPVLPALTELES